MTISSLAPAAANKPQTGPTSVQARAVDGDYKVKNANSSTVKDADGDYKPRSAAASSSTAVQSALLNIRLGG